MSARYSIDRTLPSFRERFRSEYSNPHLAVMQALIDAGYRVEKSEEWITAEACGQPNCLVGDTVIAGDYKPIAQFASGDHYIGIGQGRVVSTFRRFYRGEIVTLKARGMLSLRITPEHRVLAFSSKHIHERGEALVTEARWKMASELRCKHRHKNGDFLSLPILRGYETRESMDLSSFTSQHGLKMAKAWLCPLVYPITEKTAWLLGLYVAEGYSSRNYCCFALGKHEVGLARRVQEIAAALDYKAIERERRTAVQIEIHSALLSRAFRTWCGKGAANKRIPEFILLHARREILASFLEGYEAGDGYENRERNYVETVTVSKILALQLQLAYARLGHFAYIYDKPPRPTVRIEGRLVSEHPAFRIRVNLNQPHKSFTRRSGEFIATPLLSSHLHFYEGMVYNLQTEDQTYLASNQVVHNCHHRWKPDIRLADSNILVEVHRPDGDQDEQLARRKCLEHSGWIVIPVTDRDSPDLAVEKVRDTLSLSPFSRSVAPW